TEDVAGAAVSLRARAFDDLRPLCLLDGVTLLHIEDAEHLARFELVLVACLAEEPLGLPEVIAARSVKIELTERAAGLRQAVVAGLLVLRGGSLFVLRDTDALLLQLREVVTIARVAARSDRLHDGLERALAS